MVIWEDFATIPSKPSHTSCIIILHILQDILFQAFNHCSRWNKQHSCLVCSKILNTKIILIEFVFDESR